MAEQTLITVAVCTYARATYLRRTLATLIAQETPDFSYEIVVIDDESPDTTPDVVAEAEAKSPVPVRYVLQPGRQGLAHVRNRAIDEARGEYLVYFDDDQLAEPDWLAHLVAVVRDHNAEVAGGSRRLHLPKETMNRLGPECRSLLGENLYVGAPEILSGKHLPSSGNLLLSVKVFEKAGRFDAGFTGGEDSEFLHRLRGAGYAIWTAPNALCGHLIPQYRTEPAYFRWTSLRWGNGFAKIDAKKHGRMRMAGYAMARVGQALLLTLPRFLMARVRGDHARALDLQLLLWRAQGYARTALWLLAPRLFPQRHFIEYTDFGQERQLFPKQEPAL